LRPDGTRRSVEASVSPIKAANGSINGFRGTVRDITERKQAEEALRESEVRFRELFNRMSSGVAVYEAIDNGGNFIFKDFNPAAEKIEKVSRKDILGKRVSEVFPGVKAFGIFEVFQRVWQTGKPEYYPPNIYKDERDPGSWRECWVFKLPTGEIVAIYDNITERKRAEENLRQSEIKWHELFEILPVGVSIVDSKNSVIDTNSALAQILDLSRVDLLKGKFKGRKYLRPDKTLMPPDEFPSIRAVNEQKIIRDVEIGVEKEDGTIIWTSVSATPFSSESGSVTVTVDITERKQTQTLQEAVYQIAAAAETTSSLDELYPQIHQIISSVMPAENFYITLYDEAQNLLRFPYFKDAQDESFRGGIQPGKGLNAYVLRTGKSLLCTQAMHDELERKGEVKLLGVPSAIWLGVPLVVEGKTIGAMVVQHYSDPKAYGEREQHMLEFVSTQVAIAISRKQAEESLRRSQQATAHANRLLLALSQAAQSVQRARTQEEVYAAIQEQMTQLGYQATVFELSHEEKGLRLVYLNYASDLVRKAEKMTGLSMRDYRLHPRHGSVYERVLAQGETVHVRDAALAVADTIPKKYRLLARPVADLFHLQPSTFAPLLVGDETIGVLTITGLDLTEADNPAITAFAHQAAIAIQNAQLYEQAQREIAERKRAEDEIRQLNATLEQRVEERTRELREAQEQLVRSEKLATLGQLAGGVGHELRNPLSVINTSIYYLKLTQPEASEKIKEHHAMIEQEVHNADKIISDLLDFARVISSDRKPVSAAKLVRQTLKRFPVPPSVKVTLKLPLTLPMVFADPRQVEQVLGNLTTNACQAMVNGGKLTISARLHKGLSENDAPGGVTAAGDGGGSNFVMEKEMVGIAVKDTGTGITPENMKKLFEPLFTTKAKGIGLGLAVSQKLAEANGGRIEVESEVGKGSTFTLYLPVKP
jgi:PAS domain S-box-containing protein